MELNTYEKQTKPLAVELSGKETLNLEYYVNYMTVPKIEELNKILEKGKITNQEFDVIQVRSMLASADVTRGGKPVPFNTDAEKDAVLKCLSTHDLIRIISAVTEDIIGETKNDSTDSVDG